MFDLGVISLIFSGIVAVVEVLAFLFKRSIHKDQVSNTFAKTESVKIDLDTIRKSIEEQKDNLVNIGDEIKANSTDIAVIKERIANEKEFINKLDEKLDKILNEMMYKE